jgi:phospholipid/cholesterol/gamma-HCH transport system substrate-binding protein
VSGTATRVGLLLIVALGVAMATVFTLGRQQKFWERKTRYQLHLARTGGLREGAQVSLSGVVVGAVETLAFPSDVSQQFIDVTISVESDVTDRVRQNTVATIRTLGLLGDRYVELTPGSSDEPPVEAGGLITTVDPVDYEAVLGQSGDIVTNVVEVTASLKDVLGSIQRGEGLLGAMVRNKSFGEATLRDLEDTLHNVRETSVELRSVLARVERGEGLMGRMVRDSDDNRRLLARLDHGVEALDRAATQIADGQGALGRLATDRAWGDRVLSQLDETSRNLRDVSAKIAASEGTLGKLVNDPTLYDQSTALVREVRSSWVVTMYRALAGLWPFDATPPAEAPAP